MDVVQRDVAVLFVQRTQDVEFLVDHLQRRRSRADQGSRLCGGASVFGRTHRNQEKHHAGEGKTTGVAQVTCGEMSKQNRVIWIQKRIKEIKKNLNVRVYMRENVEKDKI